MFVYVCSAASSPPSPFRCIAPNRNDLRHTKLNLIILSLNSTENYFIWNFSANLNVPWEAFDVPSSGWLSFEQSICGGRSHPGLRMPLRMTTIAAPLTDPKVATANWGEADFCIFCVAAEIFAFKFSPNCRKFMQFYSRIFSPGKSINACIIWMFVSRRINSLQTMVASRSEMEAPKVLHCQMVSWKHCLFGKC